MLSAKQVLYVTPATPGRGASSIPHAFINYRDLRAFGVVVAL